MSERPRVYVSYAELADPGVSPNAYVGRANAEVRLSYTPTDIDTARRVLMIAIAEALVDFEKQAEKLANPPPSTPSHQPIEETKA